MATVTKRQLISAMYTAVFHRAPDAAGLAYWEAAFSASTSGGLTRIAQGFTQHPAFTEIYSSLNNLEFVNAIYQNVLGGPGDAGGVQYWTNQLNNGVSRSQMLASFVQTALTVDLDAMKAAGNLTDAEYTAAVVRQNLLLHKADVGLLFADLLGADSNLNPTTDTSTITGLMGDPMYLASQAAIRGINSDPQTVSNAIALLHNAVAGSDPIAYINLNAPGDTGAATNIFTLKEAVTDATPGTPDVTAVYWGYTPGSHGHHGELGGIPVEDLLDFVTAITGLDLAELGLIDDDGKGPFDNVTSLTLSGDVLVDNHSGFITIGFSDGTSKNAEVELGEEYMNFLNNLLFDEHGHSRLFEKVIVEGTDGDAGGELEPIILMPSQNNGGTIENGVTTAANDTIVAGRLELLHGAYIDGGAGYNILEVDAKGTYAQPLQLLNIQEVRVQNLPNVYTTPYGQGGEDDYLNNSNYPLLGNGAVASSVLDLSRATSIEKLILTEGWGTGVDLGSLTIVGIRNGATARFEGGFSEEVSLHYGQGLTGQLNIELAVGDIDTGFNIIHNASVLNVDSQGIENHMHYFNSGYGSLSRMYITGTGVFAVDQDLGSSFNSGRPAIIDASANIGGLDVTLNGHYNVTILGTQANDEITARNSTEVVIEAGNGRNVIDVDGSETVQITSGNGNDTISARGGVNVTINAGDGNNIITTDDSETVTIATGAGNDTISSVRGEAVTIDAGNGANTITVSAREINIATGNGNDTITISGMDQDFVNGDDSVGNNDNYDVGVNDFFSPGALLTINVGTGNNTIVLGRDVDLNNDGSADVQFGITALEGSSITGSGISLFVENDSDLTEADLSGATITNVTLKQELTLTAEQFAAIGSSAFNVYRAAFGATEDLHIVVTEDTTLSDLIDLSTLSINVRLNFELRDGATLTLSAEELHKHVAEDGIISDDGLNGKVVITGAGVNFNAFDNGDDFSVIDGGTLSEDFFTSDDVTIIRSADGFNRPLPGDSTDTTVIDSTGLAPLVITETIEVDGGNPTTLKFIGNQDVIFEAPIDLGDGELRGNIIDFSDLDGNLIDLTVKNFDNIAIVKGNNTDTRINVELTGDVGYVDAEGVHGLVTSGVETYVVTSIVDNDNNDGDNSTHTATFYLCDETQDVDVIGLKGNDGKTLTFAEVPWGLVAPSILLEGDGYADWNGGLKADGNPDASDIGTVIVEYFTPGAPAVVNINNGGVELGVNSTGGERIFDVDGIELVNAASLTLNITEGDAVIDHIAGDTLETLTVVATEDVTITDELPTSLTAINAAGVVGAFTVTVDNPDGDFTFVGSQGGSSLTLMEFEATDDTSIDGGAGGVVLTIGGEWPGDNNVTLSAATLANVTGVVLNDGAILEMSVAQVTVIGAANFSLTEGASGATLNLYGLDGEPFALADFADLPETVTISVLTVAALPEVTLHPDTDLTGIGGLEVPEGTILNLTAAQFQQLNGAGIITGDGTVNITDLTQADVDFIEEAGVTEGLDLSGISANVGTITLAESVTLLASDDLGDFDTIVLGDNMTLGLGDIQQGNGLNVSGGTNTTLKFTDGFAGLLEGIDASGFDVDVLQVLNILVDNRNIEFMFANLSSDVLVEIYNDLGWVSAIERQVTIEEGTTVPGWVGFNAFTDDSEVRTLKMNLQGGVEISDDIRLATVEKDDNLIPTHFQTLTINSNGTAANLLTGVEANVIAGNITAAAQGGLTVENNLKTVIINAEQDFVVEGKIIFNSVTGNDAVTANDDDEAVATLEVNGTANVTINDLDTSDDDVDSLVINHTGTGGLTVGLSSLATIDADDLITFNGSATGLDTIVISGEVDLSDDILVSVDAIELNNENDDAGLTLSQAQLDEIGPGNLSVTKAVGGQDAHLHIVELGADPFDATAIDAAIEIVDVTIAEGNITLDPSTNLTGVGKIIVPEGSTLNLTAAQFQQLAGAGIIEGVDADGNPSTDITINITGLTQADINIDLNADGDFDDLGETFDLNGISADNLTVTLAEDVNLDDDAELNNAQVNIGDGLTLGLANWTQADGLVANGGVNSTVVFQFDSVPSVFTQIDASGYSITTLKSLATFIGGNNAEFTIDDLPSSVELRLYQDPEELGFLSPTHRSVFIEAGVVVPDNFAADSLIFNDWDSTDEVRSLTITMDGGVEINGDISLPTRTDKDGGLVQRFFDVLTLVSQGAEENLIDGDIDTVPSLGFPPNTSENNLLKVVIDASQDLVIDGDIVFNSIDVPDNDAVASLTINGTADVTVEQLNTADVDISTLAIANNGTGTLTVTGASPAIDGDNTEKLILTGTGDIVLGSNPDVATEWGISADELSVLDASGLSGDLDLGVIRDIDGQDFVFTAGTGITKMTLVNDELNADVLADPVQTGWTFDFSNAAAGSEFHLGNAGGGNLVFTQGPLNINLGANTTLYIDESMDLTGLDLSVIQTLPIVLADGAILTLTAEQADGLNIVAGEDTGAAGITAQVNIVDLGDTPVDFSGIAADIADTVTLEDNDVTLDVATDLGEFTVALDSLTNTDLSGQTIRFQTVAQAERDITVTDVAGPGTNSSNVVWLFTDIAAPVDTSGYDADLGRLWFTDELINNEGGLVESLFTTLPSTVLRVDFADVTALDILLASNQVDRTVEFVNFTTVNDLTFSDVGATPEEHIHSLTLELGGQVTIGDILVDDVIAAPDTDPSSIDFVGLTIESHRALSDTHYLAAETYVNNNNGTDEPGEHLLPNNINTVGNIGVGAVNGVDLLSVSLDTLGVSTVGDGSQGDGAALQVGTITYGYVPTVADPTETALLDVTGENNINITSVNTSDADITALTVDATGFTAVLTAPGASPALQLDNTESLTFTNGDSALGTITLGDDAPVNAGIVGNELSTINADHFDGTLNLGIIAQIDSTNDDRNNDGDTLDPGDEAFSFITGSGVTTATLAAANGKTPQLNTNSQWVFDYSASAPGSYLRITNEVVFQAGAILTLTNVPLFIEGDVNLSEVVLNLTGGSINVPAGHSLTLSVAQVLALGIDIEGEGTVAVVGDGTDVDPNALGLHLKTVGVDLSAITLLPADADSQLAVVLTGALDDNGDPVGQNIIGSANVDAITASALNDTITGGAGDDILNGGGGDDTYIVDAGTDTIVGLNDGDVLVVSAGATAEADLVGSFTATAATVNDGTVVLTDADLLLDSTIDVSLAGGSNGFTLIGGTDPLFSADTLIGSNQADIINGGNNLQLAATAKDTLTGNGGADKFVFDISMSQPVQPLQTLQAAAVDSELITVLPDFFDDDDETITITYVLNGVASAIIIDNDPALNVTDVTAVASAIAQSLDAVNGITASAALGLVSVSGDNGNSVSLVGAGAAVGGTVVGLAALYGPNVDVAQDVDLTIDNAIVEDEVYSVLVTLAEGQTIGAEYTAVLGDTGATVAAGLMAAFNAVAAPGTVDVTVVGNVLTFLDENADNGGFTLTAVGKGAVIGSGASALGAATLDTLDVITDFVSGEDTISFGLAAGEASNYAEAGAAADYATALANAELAMDGTVMYYLTSSTADDTGLLFFDANADGDVDGAVQLTGINSANFAFTDIVA